jgi:hypothetical protein
VSICLPATTWGNLTIAKDGGGTVSGTLSNVVGPASADITVTVPTSGDIFDTWGAGVLVSGLPSSDLTVLSLDFNASANTWNVVEGSYVADSVSSTELYILAASIADGNSVTLIFQTTSPS